MSIQIIPPQHGTSFILNKGQKLKVIDPQGEQVADLFCFAKDNPREVLSSGRSIDYGDTILFSTNDVLYSQLGNPLLRIIEDTCSRHDFLVTPCSLQMFQMIEKNSEYHPSCHENLEKSFKEFPVNTDQIGTTFNIFMHFSISDDGKIQLQKPASTFGDYIIFQAEKDLIIGLTACSDEGTNNGSCKKIHFEIIS